MKTLILILTFSTFAAAEPEMGNQQAVQKLMSVARDIENEKILEGVGDLQDCKKQNPVPVNATDADLAPLRRCISGKFAGKSPEAIAQISDKLQLETYKLIPSRSAQNISNYLTSKMYKSMTGVDLNDQDQRNYEKLIKSQKFGTKKMLDQKDFFELYKNQMSKNVIYEISRFCFLDFRNASGVTSTNFFDHWDNLNAFGSTIQKGQNPTGVQPADNGEASPSKFEITKQTSSDAQASYTDIMASIVRPGTNINPDNLGNFFQYCANQIDSLCKTYEQSCASSPSKTCSGNGGKACLTKNRIVGFRKAIAASDESIQEFLNANGNDYSAALDPNQTIKRYQGGRERGEQSYNQLTNSASVDFIKANEGEDYKKAEECIQNRGTECDEFSIVNDSVDNIEKNTSIVYSAKREAELARVKALVQSQGENLEVYLSKNYPDLKVRYDKNELRGAGELENAIAARWDGQRQAMIEEIKNRIGVRQISETKVTANPDAKTDAAVKNAEVAVNEKTRLAQVIFFNNIISSSLNLKFASGAPAGRNTQALSNELDAAEPVVQGDLFDNLRTVADSGNQGNNSVDQGNTISDIGFLYDLIGLPKEEDKPNNQRLPSGR